jgi:hypothetical protein
LHSDKSLTEAGNYTLTVGNQKRNLGKWVTRYCVPNAIPFRVWEPLVPRLADKYADCAVYIYKSRADAESGVRQGGSGFIVMVPMDSNPALAHTYIVTNKHVITMAGDPVVRLNRKDGGMEFLETKSYEWVPHQAGDDISVLPFDIEEQDLKHSAIPITSFVTQSLVELEDIGIGDDTVMIGRFINHEGKQQNAPAVRFGNIAMMPKEKIRSPSNFDQESFLVETRSLPGYSGSAVLLYSPCAMNDMSVRRLGVDKSAVKPPFANRTPEEQNRFLEDFRVVYSPKGPYLLGIDWCHLPVRATVRYRDSEEPTNLVLDENSGMAGVIPAWKIIEVLYSERLTNMRRQANENLKDASSRVSLDSAEDESPFTKADFEAALKKVSGRIQTSQSDEGS